MALEIRGLKVHDLTEMMGQTINPAQGVGEPLFIETLKQVSGRLRFPCAPGHTPDAHNKRMAALRTALEAEYGPGVLEAGMGAPESPEHPLLGHFRWTLTGTDA